MKNSILSKSVRLAIAMVLVGLLVPVSPAVPAQAIVPPPADNLFMTNPDYVDPDTTPTEQPTIFNSVEVPAISVGYTLSGFDTTGFTLEPPVPGDTVTDETSSNFELGLIAGAGVYHCSNAINESDATAWYKFVPPANGIYKLSTIGSDYDTVIHVFRSTPESDLSNRFADLDWDGSEPNSADSVSCLDDKTTETEELHFLAKTDSVYYISVADVNPDDIQGTKGGNLSFSLSALDTNICDPSVSLCLVMENYFGEAFTDFSVRAFDEFGEPFKDSEGDQIVYGGDNGIVALPKNVERMIITGADTYIVLTASADIPVNTIFDVNIYDWAYRSKVELIAVSAFAKNGEALQNMDIILAVNPESEYGSLGARPGTPRIITVSTGAVYDIVIGDLSKNYMIVKEDVDFGTLPVVDFYRTLVLITDPAVDGHLLTETINANFTGFDQTNDGAGFMVIDGYLNVRAPFTENYWLWFAMDEDDDTFYPNTLTVSMPSYFQQPFRLQGSKISDVDLWQYYFDSPVYMQTNIQDQDTTVELGGTLEVNAPVKAGFDPASISDNLFIFYQTFDQFNNILSEVRKIDGGAAVPALGASRDAFPADTLRQNTIPQTAGFGADLQSARAVANLGVTRSRVNISLTDNAGHTYTPSGSPNPVLDCVYRMKTIQQGFLVNLDHCTNGVPGLWTATLSVFGGPLGTLSDNTTFRFASGIGRDLMPGTLYPEFVESAQTRSWKGTNLSLYDKVDCSTAFLGSCSFTMPGNQTPTTLSAYKAVSFSAGSTLNLTFAYNTEDARGDGAIQGRMDVRLSNGTTQSKTFIINDAGNVNFDVATGNTGGWKTSPVLSYKVPAGKTANRITVVFTNSTASGQVWFDSVSVKKTGSTTNIFGSLNPSFEKTSPYGFTPSAAYDATQYADCNTRHAGVCSFHIGLTNKNKYFTNTTRVSPTKSTEGIKGNSVHVSFWIKGDSIPATGGTYKFVITFMYTDGTQGVFTCPPLPRGTFGWTQVLCQAKSLKAFSQVRLRLNTYMPSGQLWIDDLNAGIYK